MLNLQIQEERERRHRDSDMLETHIMQAQAAAMAADEKELQKKSEGYENYHSLGLPPGNVVWVLVSKTWNHSYTLCINLLFVLSPLDS